MAEHGSGAALHVAVFPWLAFGHMLPFLQLSKSLAKRGHRVSFLSTPRNIARLPEIPPDVAPLIEFVPFTFSSVDNLPPEAESTADLLPEQVQYLKKALDGLQSPFSRFLRATRPDWLVIDFCQHWAPEIASDLGIPCAFLSIYNAACLYFLLEKMAGDIQPTRPEELTKPPGNLPFPTTVSFRLHEAKDVIWNYRDNASGISDGRRLSAIVKDSDLVAFRGCFEQDATWLSLFRTRICGGSKPVVPLGLLPPPLEEATAPDSDVGEPSATFRWLSEQSPRSVVYVAFGSEATLREEQERELASGLDLSATPFLWATRKPSGGVERRSSGLVVGGWVPQLEILRHGAVGAFLTHCGFSSAVESFQFGHPLVMLPLAIDQGLMARQFEEMKVGTEVARNEEDGSFTGEDVAAAIRKVMVEEEGKALRSNVEKLQEVFANGELHESYIDTFVQLLRDLKHKKTFE
ncbi:putative UDP-rhamnose:rhamnosyltransferase 1 [Zingiber officinale]|uniref:Glycosyltransferase n=1 Tax=Zingiber officinale TaxID=94328 RepID=A0A8J5L848_ZINOF|nr:putative UDP-rhamnose:rhamnosyltransferase 1 [Zingiber officinale]KAG6504175.1 hypothetical protein ZIOFF_036506 [Zingiber officinale]